jgi:gamma-glutamylcyclotransferase (GGCT)/AIG2-like uncharacterized protein YtfP
MALPQPKPVVEVEQDMVRIFVYGTLKRGYGNHRLLAGRSVFIGDDAIIGKLFDLGAFPAATPEGSDLIQGETYFVGPKTLRDLDRLEGHPNFYRREVVKTRSGVDAWVYFMPEISWHTRSLHYLPEGVWPPNNTRLPDNAV